MLRRLSSKSQSPGHIFKKFVDFLNSSMWDIPVATFIEQKSIVFDRDQGSPELYQSIHKEYAELVDTLIECFCDDTGIKPRQLVESLQAIEREKLNVRQRAALEPVIAAQDFNVFLPMMMRKNVELQLQALQMIEFMCGLLPEVLKMDDWDVLRKKIDLTPEEMENVILIAVLRRSKSEYDEQAQRELELDLEAIRSSGLQERLRLEDQRLCEETNLKLAMHDHQEAQSSKTALKIEAAPPPSPAKVDTVEKPKEATLKELKERPKSVERSRNKSEKSAEKETPKAEPVEEKKRPESAKKRSLPPVAPGARRSSITRADKDKPETKEATVLKEEKKGRTAADVNALLQEPSRIASADIRARSEYLKTQRDRLLEMKRSEREKQLQQSTTTSSRPRTAQAARGALRGDRPQPTVDGEVLQARKALADKLRNEVL